MPSENRSVQESVSKQLPPGWTISLVTPLPSMQGTWASQNGPPSSISSGTSLPGTLVNPENLGAKGSFAYTYTHPSGAGTTFQFTFACPDSGGGNNTAEVTAMTGGAADTTYAVPFTTMVNGANQQFCKIPSSGYPVEVTFYVYNRIQSVTAAMGPTTVMNWAGVAVPASNPIWTPGPNYNDGFGGSTNPLAFPLPIANGPVPSGQSHCLWLLAKVMSDLVTINQGNNVTLYAPMTEVITGKTIIFESAQTQTTTPPTLSPTSVYLYAETPSNFKGLAGISSVASGGAATWYMHGNRAVGTPLLEIYWLLNPPGAMWQGGDGVWVRTLRDVFTALSKVGANNPSVATSPDVTITSNCFLGSLINSPKGQKVYRDNGGAFCHPPNYNLQGYYNAPAGQSVNCADQAGFLQVCLGAVGIPSTLVHLEPAGFFNTTRLVGNPNLPCNSPDWYVYGTTAAACPAANQKPEPTVPPYGRIWWQDHYVVLECAYPPPASPLANVLDATLGPYVVPPKDPQADSVAAYIAAAIDTSTQAQQLYSYWTTTCPPPVPASWQAPAGPISGAAPPWAADTSYVLAQLIADSNCYLQKVTGAGTSGNSAPSWNRTVNGTTTDGSVIWTNQGKCSLLVGPNTGQSDQVAYSPGITSVQVTQP